MEKKTKETGLVVIDSNIFVDHLRSYLPSVEFFHSLPSSGEKALFSAITETELIAGKSCNNAEVRTIVLNMLNSFAKIEVDNRIALQAGDISRLYNTDLPDSIIAATALIHKAELLTRNVSDFKNIKGLKVKSPY